MTSIKQITKAAVHALEEKKAIDIKVIDISDISTIADYFVIASGGSAPQMQAMINSVQESMHKEDYALKRLEGNRNSSWVLMDYGDIVIHLFLRDDRLFYDLERIWSDGKEMDPAEL